jgi:excisionase family DNA binding protein
MTMRKKRFVDIEFAADYLDVSPRTIRRYISEGKLTGYRVGDFLLRVDMHEVDALAKPIPAASASA